MPAGDFHRFVQVHNLKVKIAANSLFRLGERTVGHRPPFLAGNDLALVGQRVAGDGFPLLSQPFEPGGPVRHDLLELFR